MGQCSQNVRQLPVVYNTLKMTGVLLSAEVVLNCLIKFLDLVTMKTLILTCKSRNEVLLTKPGLVRAICERAYPSTIQLGIGGYSQFLRRFKPPFSCKSFNFQRVTVELF
jgi:hypothetical protein